ncbi:hypothetical protein [Flindersiella endophytica]
MSDTQKTEPPHAAESTPVHRAGTAGRPEGPAAAALVAAGVGAFTLGLLTTLAEVSTTVKDWLTFSDSVGPLSGKVLITVTIWIVAWIVLHLALRTRAQLNSRVLTATGVLLALGILGTFPLFFQLFET